MAWVVADRTGRPFSGGRFTGAEIITFSEEATGDQDKTLSFTTDVVAAAPNAAAAELLHVGLEYIAAAGGSARAPRCDVIDELQSNDIVGAYGSVQTTAATVTRTYAFGQGLDQTSLSDPDIERLPKNLVFFPGLGLNFTAANSAAGDSMILHVTLAVYS